MLIFPAHAAETKRPKFLSIICALCFLCASSARAAEKPNILFIIADDASQHFGKTYGCEWVKTPLFNVATDPDCVVNLAADNAHAATRDRLRAALMAALDRQRDPRVLGKGEVFDHYPTVKPAPAGWTGELPKPKP